MAQNGGKVTNLVHENAIFKEMVKKQNANQQLYTTFSLHPNKILPPVTGKPNAMFENAFKSDEIDAGIAEAIAYTKLPPTKKYTTPQTEAQEYGWISTPLIESSRHDPRLWHNRAFCDVTKHKEVEWTMKLDTPKIKSDVTKP